MMKKISFYSCVEVFPGKDFIYPYKVNPKYLKEERVCSKDY